MLVIMGKSSKGQRKTWDPVAFLNISNITLHKKNAVPGPGIRCVS